MILFIDTEWADVLASELVSLALVSDCGRYQFYAERDPLPEKPTDFVRSVVYPLLERGERMLPDGRFAAELHEFFDKVSEVATYGKVLVAYDYRNDLDLLHYALDGFELPHSPPRPPFKAFNLGLLGVEFEQAVVDCLAADPDSKARRHHALVDARVNREAFLRVQAIQIYRDVQPTLSRITDDRAALCIQVVRHLRRYDPELATMLIETLGDEGRAGSWCITHSRILGVTPIEALSTGKRKDVLQALVAIRYSFPA